MEWRAYKLMNCAVEDVRADELHSGVERTYELMHSGGGIVR